jgi:hypothetical protein
MREAWAVMNLVHKIYKHEVTHAESVTERSPIIQRSYELIHQLEKKIRVGDLNANTGQEVIFQQTIGRWSSHKVSNSNGLKAADFAVSTYFPANKIHKEIWWSSDNFYQRYGELYGCEVQFRPLSGLYDELTKNIKLQEFVAGIMESKLKNYCQKEMQCIHTAGHPQIMQRELY